MVFLQLMMKRKHFSTCKSTYGRLLVVLHHILQIYILWGSLLFGFYKFHLFFITIAFFVHKTYGICPITLYHNKKCKYKNPKAPLNTIINETIRLLDLNVSPIDCYYTILGIVVLYNIHMIYKDNAPQSSNQRNKKLRRSSKD